MHHEKGRPDVSRCGFVVIYCGLVGQV
jgi:hypothetical protein